MKLEQWQEAFRSVEDLYGLMTQSKKPTKPQLMAAYYQRLAQLFWHSKHHLLHAFSWSKLYTLTKKSHKVGCVVIYSRRRT